MKKIELTEGKVYTLPEVIDFVKQTLDRVSEKSTRDPLRYSAIDVYWLLFDMLQYVNRNVPGEFILLQTEKDTYRVTYATEDVGKQRSDRKLKSEVNRTAKYLKELTGRQPPWGEKE